MPKWEARSGTTPANIESLLLESDRTLMQVVNTSLTLIGFGFTINEIFGNAASRGGDILHADLVGRLLGLALLTLGLLLLALGIRGHANMQRQLTGRPEGLFDSLRPGRSRQYHYSSVFLVAALLLAVGALTLGVAIFGMIYGHVIDGRW